MSSLTAVLIALLVLAVLAGLLWRELYRLYEAERWLARNANRDWDDREEDDP